MVGVSLEASRWGLTSSMNLWPPPSDHILKNGFWITSRRTRSRMTYSYDHDGVEAFEVSSARRSGVLLHRSFRCRRIRLSHPPYPVPAAVCPGRERGCDR